MNCTFEENRGIAGWMKSGDGVFVLSVRLWVIEKRWLKGIERRWSEVAFGEWSEEEEEDREEEVNERKTEEFWLEEESCRRSCYNLSHFPMKLNQIFMSIHCVIILFICLYLQHIYQPYVYILILIVKGFLTPTLVVMLNHRDDGHLGTIAVLICWSMPQLKEK